MTELTQLEKRIHVKEILRDPGLRRAMLVPALQAIQHREGDMTTREQAELEEWRDIPGYEGAYQASSWGRVRSLARAVLSGYNKTRNKRERVLASVTHHSGYQIYGLRDGKNSKNYYGHTLILLAFIGPRPEGMVACHHDGNRSNNWLVNLRYATRADNEQDKRRHGTFQEGEQATNVRLSEPDIFRIRERRAAGEDCAAIGADYDMRSGHISKICTGEAWANSPGAITRNHYRVRRPQPRMSDADIVAIRIRRANGELCHNICADYGCSNSLISAISTGNTRPDAGGPITRKRNTTKIRIAKHEH